MRTRPPEVRKQQLLKAARAVLAKKGFAQMRVSDVVARAGMSQGAFYLHFSSKQEIVAELFRSLINQAAALIQARHSPADDMKTMLRNTISCYYKVCFEYRDVLENAEGIAGQELDRGQWNELYRPLNEFMLELVRTWQARDEIPREADPNIVSWLIIDTVNGAMERLFGYAGNRVSKNYEAYVIDWLISALQNLNLPVRKGRQAAEKSGAGA